jgi:hypothetical protein
VNPQNEAYGVILGAPSDDGKVRVMLFDDEGTVCPMRIPELDV